jgi:hypothetical protein
MEIQPALAELFSLLDGTRIVFDVLQLQVKNSTGSREKDALNYFLQEIANKKIIPLIGGSLTKNYCLKHMMYPHLVRLNKWNFLG